MRRAAETPRKNSSSFIHANDERDLSSFFLRVECVGEKPKYIAVHLLLWVETRKGMRKGGG